MKIYKVEIEAHEDIDQKDFEILNSMNKYKDAQAYQLEHGGPGPVASAEIMAIVNEFDGKYFIEQKDAPVAPEVDDGE